MSTQQSWVLQARLVDGAMPVQPKEPVQLCVVAGFAPAHEASGMTVPSVRWQTTVRDCEPDVFGWQTYCEVCEPPPHDAEQAPQPVKFHVPGLPLHVPQVPVTQE